jgi:serine/threonine protein kinase
MALLDKYQYIKVIGEGYFSNVQLYKDRETGQEVAVKVLKNSLKNNEEYVHRFEREVELLQLLTGHENIIKLIDYEFVGHTHLYVMEAVTTNLFEYITRNNNKLELRERLSLFDQILKAIQFARSKGILHRDISPRNILVMHDEETEPTIRVSDFGLAKNLDADSAFTHSAEAKYGQTYYVAPEQFDKLKDATEKSEIFSLGKVLDFILTGKLPITAHQTQFRSLIEKATQEDPSLRHENLQDFDLSYSKIKELLVLDASTGVPGAITKFSKPDGSIDWENFHRFGVRREQVPNTYSGYLEPVLKALSSKENLQAYIGVAGDSIEEFVDVFIQRIDELPTVGWPFSATTSFGELLRDIFYLSERPRVKIRCFTTIWQLAFEQDQYGCQDIARRILNSGSIPEEIQMDVALIITDSRASPSVTDFAGEKIPDVIKKALLQKRSE